MQISTQRFMLKYHKVASEWLFPVHLSELKKHLALQNTVGIIDSDYRGSIRLKFFNYGNEDVTIDDGEYIAQMIIVPYTSVDLQKVDTLDELSETERGAGGFGSTNNPQIKNYNNYTFEGKELKKRT